MPKSSHRKGLAPCGLQRRAQSRVCSRALSDRTEKVPKLVNHGNGRTAKNSSVAILRLPPTPDTVQVNVASCLHYHGMLRLKTRRPQKRSITSGKEGRSRQTKSQKQDKCKIAEQQRHLQQRRPKYGTRENELTEVKQTPNQGNTKSEEMAHSKEQTQITNTKIKMGST